ncbi:Crp/Fnr family transcriptional regulator [Hansschlegelia beijingensis]|uniref:Crp/Fnr family transcriptional regulator n=1 Tax=Hansschlegelia beijingensis TaxID=1133344 RepID=UPI00387EF0DF
MEGAAGLEPAARSFERERGQFLHPSQDGLDQLHFVTEGLVAILAQAPDGIAEAGLVGPAGLVEYQAALGATATRTVAVALTSVRGVAVPRSTVLQALQRSAILRRELFDYAARRIAETEQLCVCAARHSIERRLARWLLQASRLLGHKPVEITHQQFASLFGVRRASVTTSLHLLEGEMAIRCWRGRIEIRDPARLEALSCGCEAPRPQSD